MCVCTVCVREKVLGKYSGVWKLNDIFYWNFLGHNSFFDYPIHLHHTGRPTSFKETQDAEGLVM